MCGLAGIVQFDNQRIPGNLIRQMSAAMPHRGPDAEGFFEEEGIALGHRRLSIIDLSTAANQPFADHSGRYQIIFNGEMYNYSEVKKLLPEYPFRTGSDTEVLLAAYIQWGPDCIRHFAGMFAFAIWDRREKEIFLARDRMGVKPLYYSIDRHRLLFASETRSILATGLVDRKLSKQALKDYFSYQSVSFPESIVEGISQVEAGTWIRISNGQFEKKSYWDITRMPIPDFDFTDSGKVKKNLRKLLAQAVERRLVSDVPVAAFLSGGIDSGTIVGLMAEAGQGRPNTFTLAFEETDYDESAYAEAVHKKFNTNHTRVLVKPTSLLDQLDQALTAMDSPSGDGINTWLVSKTIRQQGLKVAVSGVGGDELFAGYPFFTTYLRLRKLSWLWQLPAPLRRIAAWSASGRQREKLRQLLQEDACSIDKAYPVFREVMGRNQLQSLTRICQPGDCSTSLQKILLEKKSALENFPLLSQVSMAEYLGYTQHTLLKDGDQMSMASSLELREPFFDHELVEFVMAIPDQVKKPVYPKSLLVESVKPLLPDEIVFRKKQGFLFPWEEWLKKDLRLFCEQHINRMAERDFIHEQALKLHWKAFLKGDPRVRWQELWLFVVLDYWLEKNNVQ